MAYGIVFGESLNVFFLFTDITLSSEEFQEKQNE